MGPCAKIVTTALPVLYSFRRCPYAIRARLALGVSGVAYELREVTLKNKPLEMLALSPKGTVPVLVLGSSQTIDESLDIMRWALAMNDPQGWLAQGALPDMLGLIAQSDGPFKHALDRYKYPTRYPLESLSDVKAFGLAHRQIAVQWLQTLEPRLGKGWLFGSQVSLADMALLPFMRQFTHTDKLWFAAQPWPCLQAWLARFEASAVFASVMGKHDSWEATT